MGCRKASNQSFRPYTNQRTAKPSYCLMAKPRLLLRTETQPLGMAAHTLICKPLEDLYTQASYCPTTCSDAGKRQPMCCFRVNATTRLPKIIIVTGFALTPALPIRHTADKVWRQGTGKDCRTSYTIRRFENPLKRRYIPYLRNRQKERKHGRWIPEIPQKLDNMVYVSYQTVPNSMTTPFATVYHKAGINSKSTRKWGRHLGLSGTFGLGPEKAMPTKVTLSNRSAKAGQTVTADAVKIGGGMLIPPLSQGRDSR